VQRASRVALFVAVFAALFAGFVPFASQSRASDYYVNKGTDCTRSYPRCGVDEPGREFDDVDQCARILAPGDTCWIKNGTYSYGASSRGRHTYVTKRSGRPESPLTFRAYPGHRPVFRDGGNWDLGVSGEQHFVVYSGLVIEGVLLVQGSSEAKRVRGVRIVDFEISGGGGKSDGNWAGIFAQWTEDLVIANNIIRDARVDQGLGGSESAKGITLFNGRRTLVEHNYIHGHPSEGIFDKEGGEDNVYRRNVFWDNKVGIKVNNQGDSRDVQNERTLIYENVFVCEDEDTNEAIRMLHQPTDWVIRNNTGYECASIVVRSSSGPADGGVVYNNIWWSSTTEKTMWESQNGDDREPAYMDYNLYAPNGKYRENRYTDESKTRYSLSSWRSTPHPLWYDANSFEGDPIFVDPENGDFHLAVGSPAIGAGLYGEDLGAYPLGNEESVGPPPNRYDCIPSGVSDCPDATVPDAETEDLACGGSCKSIPSFPIQGVALGALVLALLEMTLSEITRVKAKLQVGRAPERRKR